MTITLIYLSILPTILTIILGIILFKFIKLSKQTSELHSQSKSSLDVVMKSQLTSYEIERLEREEQFDKRIAALSDELSTQRNVIRHGVMAEELHPLVHNLPHDAVETRYDLSSYEEVAE